MTVADGVRCPGCGRVYASARFASGRVIDCTCGARVGPAPLARALPRGAEARFFADAMLGRLARWLRVLGFDTVYEAHIPDEELVRRALAERRVILTRDRQLPGEWRVSGVLVLDSNATLEQLREVLERFDLWPHLRPFTRCTQCNAELRDASAEAVAKRVPRSVRARPTLFTQCPRCGRVFWHGSHTGRVLRILDRIRAAG
ncbi:MAG: Mut7-C RNAse domain-containing protein [Planctomycetota bacterium]|jgi:uncharacterized protein with PIN domain